MRVTDVSLWTGQEQAVKFSLRKANPNERYYAKAIVGLDADELTPKFYAQGRLSKEKYYDFVPKKRELVLRLVLNPRFDLDETYSDIRDDVYRAISSSRSGQVALQFNAAGTAMARVWGFITKVEASHFSNQPEVQLTIESDYARLRGVNPIVYGPADLGNDQTVKVADGSSTCPHGLYMKLQYIGSASNFIIYDQAVDWEWSFHVTENFIAGDTLTISNSGNDYQLFKTRSGVDTHLMHKVNPSSVWPIIFPRANSFYIPSKASFDWIEISYYPEYWGV